MHQSSIDKMRSFKEKYLQDRQSEKLNIFDLGSQNIGGSYRSLFDSPQWAYFGVDLEDGENVDIVLRNAYKWDEIQSNSVDVLISGQTLEHIEYFWLTILEIARVLKPDGICCLIAPSSGYEHRYPVDCWRFYPDGMTALANFAKLKVLESRTQWQDEDYADGSNVWHDSMLIATKPMEDIESVTPYEHFDQRYSQILTEPGQLELYRLQLARSQGDVAHLQNQLHAKVVELMQLQAQHQNILEAMEKSFFWKLRTQWFKLKDFVSKLSQSN
jgi:SAM-dependent methyltransferase